MSWPQIKKNHWSVIFSYWTQEQCTISWPDCDLQWKLDFIWQLVMTSSVVGPRSSKALPSQSQSRKGHGYCLVVCLWSDLLQLSESWRNCYIWEVYRAIQWDTLKTAMPAAAISQQRGPSSSQQYLNAYHTTNTSKVEQTGLQSLPHLPYSSDLSPADCCFKHLNNFLQGNHFHNQQEAENAFEEFVESRSTNFYAIGINKLVSNWWKMYWL